MATFTESVVEDASLAWLEALGYSVLHGPHIAAGEPAAERSDPNCCDVVPSTLITSELRMVNTNHFLSQAV